MSGFRRASSRRGRPGADAVLATFAPFEIRLLRQFVHELVLLLQAEAGAGTAPVDESDNSDNTADDADNVDDEFAAITARSGLGTAAAPGPVAPPEDAVIARLFPDAYVDDDESATDFRRFTQDRLVESKHASAQAVLAMLWPNGDPDDVEDDDDDDDEVEIGLNLTSAMQWLGTLNDIRLALGTRLGIEQDDDVYWDSLPADDPRGTVHEIYQWLGWMQETLVAALPRPRR